MLEQLAKGLLGRLLGYGALLLGFWLLFQGFLRPNIIMGILGGGTILGGMYLLVASRRSATSLPKVDQEPSKEDRPGDTIPGSDQGN
ncbi:MAG: hypothetical protein ACE5Q6_05820 [Dehalococcoidia bacterium]